MAKSSLFLIWCAFVLRGLFYCSFVPLWEGYDEWAHFAYIQQLAVSGEWLVDRDEMISREVGTSLRLAPVPWELRTYQEPSVTEDTYWRLPEPARIERQRQLVNLPMSWGRERDGGGLRIYEALQPPLYYWAMSAVYRMAAKLSLLDRVYLLRYVSLLLGSLLVPLTYLIVRRVAAERVALVASVLVTLMPELMVNLCRVGNECLGIVLYSCFTLLCLELFGGVPGKMLGLRVGVVLGLGLLTKAYFLTALPAVAVLFLWMFWRTKTRAYVMCQGIAAAGSALLVAGWWYHHNLVTTGTLSGLSESVSLLHYTPEDYLDGALRLPWLRAVDSILVSHIWYGAWSSLLVRSWIYHFFFGVIAAVVAGVGLQLWRQGAAGLSPVYPLISVYGFLWVGQLYNVLLLFLSKGAATSMGWYLYSVVSAEVALLVLGLLAFVRQGHVWILCALAVCFAALDLYSVHFVSIPYYSGLTAHLTNGSIAAFHLGQLQKIGLGEILVRLSVNKASWLGAGMLGALWGCYFLGTCGLLIRGVRRDL